MLPSQIPEFQTYPAVHQFAGEQLDLLFAEVRVLLRLPLPEVGIAEGCTYAAAAALCNLISGISMTLYTPRDPKSGHAKVFRELLKEYYPWELREFRSEKVRVIYELVRNPLAHSLGVLEPGELATYIEKSPLTEVQMEEMEAANARPDWIPPAVTFFPTHHILSVGGLYWGVFHLLRRLARDTKQMQQAEKRIASWQ